MKKTFIILILFLPIFVMGGLTYPYLLTSSKGEIIYCQAFYGSEEIINEKFNIKKIYKPEFENPGDTFYIPKLSDGRKYQNAFKEKFDFNQDDSCSNKFDPNAVPLKEELIQKENEKAHKIWRQKQDTLDGVYIPKDLKDCFRELDQILCENDKEKIKNRDPNSFHFGLGRNLRNRWGLWSSSRLRTYFLSFGISHPDEMSGIILDNYKKHLKGLPVNFEQEREKHRLKIILKNNLETEKK